MANVNQVGTGHLSFVLLMGFFCSNERRVWAIEFGFACYIKKSREHWDANRTICNYSSSSIVQYLGDIIQSKDKDEDKLLLCTV